MAQQLLMHAARPPPLAMQRPAALPAAAERQQAAGWAAAGRAAEQQRALPASRRGSWQRMRQPLVSATAAPTLTLRRATTPAELRACGALRAAAFAVVPSDRSEFARQSFLRMKADAAWHTLEAKVSGTDVEYRDVTVTPLIAVAPAAECPPGAHAACMLPAEPGGAVPSLVVGCLDLNQGVKLPAEDLIGRLPAEGDKRRLRAYISNVATWAGARRQGVARSLLREAMREAAAAGVQHLYVHVEVCNTAASALYLSTGFEVESEESEAFARAQNRNRRLLLHTALG